MSLFGALNLGKTSLVTQQAALQVTGANISNANTPGYSRQVAQITTGAPDTVGNDILIGGGATLSTVQRQVDEAVNSSLRDASSQQNQATTLQTYLSQLESTFGALNSGDLASQMTSFFSSFSTLAENPSAAGQSAVVLQNGTSLASGIQSLRSQLLQVRSSADSQIQTQAVQANSLASQIASLNTQITATEGGGGTPNSLLDQRDQALTNLSQIMNISTVTQANGQVNVLVGSNTLVQGSVSRGISTTQTADPTGQLTQTNLVFADNGDSLQATGGTIGGLLTARDTYIAGALNTLDTLTNGLITTVNTISSQGQGLTGFSSLTGTTAVSDPTAALNSPTLAGSLPSTPTSGTFNFQVTDSTTGNTTTQQIKIDPNGTPPTSLNSLAASLTSGPIVATVDATGHLNITSNNPNDTFSFSNDTSGVLAALGVNTIFSGTNASNIAVNSTLTSNPNLLATGQNNQTGSNANAQALAAAGTNPSSLLGGQSLSGYYTQYIGTLATQSAAAQDNATAQTTVFNTLTAQQQSVSGVDMDEETINMMKYQQAYEGSAHFVSVVNQMMTDMLTMLS